MFMFLLRRSPFGGNPMREILEEEKAPANIEPEPFKRWEVKSNYFCIKLGYASEDIKRGERIYVRPEEIVKVYQILKRAVDK